jgi:hypothetical protein
MKLHPEGAEVRSTRSMSARSWPSRAGFGGSRAKEALERGVALGGRLLVGERAVELAALGQAGTERTWWGRGHRRGVRRARRVVEGEEPVVLEHRLPGELIPGRQHWTDLEEAGALDDLVAEPARQPLVGPSGTRVTRKQAQVRHWR